MVHTCSQQARTLSSGPDSEVAGPSLLAIDFGRKSPVVMLYRRRSTQPGEDKRRQTTTKDMCTRNVSETKLRYEDLAFVSESHARKTTLRDVVWNPVKMAGGFSNRFESFPL